jgi:hypothetical protein
VGVKINIGRTPKSKLSYDVAQKFFTETPSLSQKNPVKAFMQN